MASHSVVRQSKFRHVFGRSAGREQTFHDLRLSRDGSLCAVNPRFLAVSVEAGGGGAFLVLPVGRPGRVAQDHPLVAGHSGAVLDMAWCPHDDSVIASGSEDSSAIVWQVSEDEDVPGRPVVTEPLVVLEGHSKRVSVVTWHPAARNVLLTAGGDNLIIVWNAGTGEPLVSLDERQHPDVVYAVSWNRNGSLFVTTCRDRTLRVCDARTGRVVAARPAAHQGVRPATAVFTRDGNVFTTGFTRMSQRELALWSPALEPVARLDLDTGNGVMTPHYDADASLVYLSARGESSVLYFEVTEQPPFVHFLGRYTAKEPQRGGAVGFMPRRGLDVARCEVARLYRLLHGRCEPVAMTVPRKSERFQDDLYPDTAGPEAAMEPEEWLEGRDDDPVLVSMRPPPKSHDKKNVLDSTGPSAMVSSSSAQMMERLKIPSSGSSPYSAQLAELKEIQVLKAKVSSSSSAQLAELKEIQDLKAKVLSQEKTICDLENELSHYNL